MIYVVNYFIGGLILLIGRLIGSNPSLVSGYYSMSKEKRKDFDTKGKLILKSCFYYWATYLFVGTFISYLLSWETGNMIVLISSFVLFSGVIYYRISNYNKSFQDHINTDLQQEVIERTENDGF